MPEEEGGPPVEPVGTNPADETPTGWPTPVAETAAERRRRRTPWVTAFAFLALQLVAVYLPGTPDEVLELPWVPGVDKLVHTVIFAVPVYLFARLTGRVGLVAGVFAVHAVVSELIQWRFVPYRDGDVWDATADLVGIGIGMFLVVTRPTSWR